MADLVRIREVGLRDGLQLVKDVLPTELKLEWIEAATGAGLPEIEVTSYVPPHVIPQFADADAVTAAALEVPGTLASALAVNLKGAERAYDLGIGKINYVISASEMHSRANVRRTRQEALEAFRAMAAERRSRGLEGKVALSCGIATAFGCTLQGEVAEADVLRLVAEAVEAGADEIMIADTVGYADPLRVRRLFAAVLAETGRTPVAAHFHDTRGLGLANVMAAAETGIRRFDASLGGLGGCPFAPGATGNIDTEDTVYLLETQGLSTGIDMRALLDLRSRLSAWLPNETLGGAVQKAGIPGLAESYPSLATAMA